MEPYRGDFPEFDWSALNTYRSRDVISSYVRVKVARRDGCAFSGRFREIQRQAYRRGALP